MSNSALIMMISYCSLMTIMAGYFFYRVITTKKDSHSYQEEENEHKEHN